MTETLESARVIPFAWRAPKTGTKRYQHLTDRTPHAPATVTSMEDYATPRERRVVGADIKVLRESKLPLAHLLWVIKTIELAVSRVGAKEGRQVLGEITGYIVSKPKLDPDDVVDFTNVYQAEYYPLKDRNEPPF